MMTRPSAPVREGFTMRPMIEALHGAVREMSEANVGEIEVRL